MVQYKHTRNNVTKLIRHAKRDFYTSRLSNPNTTVNEMWKVLKDVLPGNKISSNKHLPDPQTFNDFFSSIGKRITDKFGDVNPNHFDFNLISLPLTRTLSYKSFSNFPKTKLPLTLLIWIVSY